MLISSVEELRLYTPAHAIDNFDTIAGYFDSSEYDFLIDKLGPALHTAITEYYSSLVQSADGIRDFINAVRSTTPMEPMMRLLSLCQRVIAFDALGRSIDIQAVSVNGSGVNFNVASDYPKAEREAIIAYKNNCIKESHAAVNRLLVALEEWTQQQPSSPASASGGTTQDSAPESGAEPVTVTASDPVTDPASPTDADPAVVNETVNDSGTTDSDAQDDTQQQPAQEQEDPRPTPAEQIARIVELWRNSRYYYLAAGLIIPSASVLQNYYNIYDSRERFIQLLAELRFIQETYIGPVIGEDLMEYLIDHARNTPAWYDINPRDLEPAPRFLARLIHMLRKTVASYLEATSAVLKVTEERKVTARNEAVMGIKNFTDYVTVHQGDFPTDEEAQKALHASPLYVAPAPPAQPKPERKFQNNAPGSVLFVTPALDH